MLNVTAIVVARGGSKRLPNKALLPFGASTLIGHKVDTLRACKLVDRVVVGSDSTSILSEAITHGADIIHRDDYHCDESKCTANEMIADMARRVNADVILWAHPTNPLVRAETYDRAVQAYVEGLESGHDSLLSVTRVQRHAWQDGKPANYDPWADRHTFASELTPMFFQDGAIFIQSRAAMLANRYFFGRKPVLFEIAAAESTDIDTKSDYDIACALQSYAPAQLSHDGPTTHGPATAA